MEFEMMLLHQLYQTTRIISKGLNKRLEPLGIYTSEWSIILLLKENGVMTQVGLANYLNIEPPAITNSLNKLEKKGFIERKPGVDKREKKVYLSETARKQYAKWEKAVNDYRNLIFADFTELKEKELSALLKTIFLSAQQAESSEI